jgi:hypothetical protein
MASGITYQQARELVKQICQATDQDELKHIISDNISRCDAIFFSELESVVEEYRGRNDLASALKLKEVGDYMARLRFMI